MTATKTSKAKASEDFLSLNKHISNTGFCSRREADDYINQGRVTINGKPANMGNRATDNDVVEIDGEPLKKKKKTVYIAFHKPKGITCTTDTADKTNIVECIQIKERIFPIGRLDKESEGLIFLTNDGNIVNKILRAGNNHAKEYVVTVDKPISTQFVKQMSEGVRILHTMTKPCKVVQENKFVFRITLTQGMNRQIRRMCDVLDYKVKKLIRVRIMNVHLGKLPLGHWRYLLPEEIDIINSMVSGSVKTEEASVIVTKKKLEATPKQSDKKTTAKKPDKKPITPKPKPEKKKSTKTSRFKEFREKGKKKK